MHIITLWLGPCTISFDDSQQSQFSHSHPAKLELIFTYHTGGTIQQKCVAKFVLFVFTRSLECVYDVLTKKEACCGELFSANRLGLHFVLWMPNVM